jgi:hypothetical protein
MSDIRINEQAVVVDGNLGLGADTPARPVHVDTGEIHSGGPAGGLSFADRSVGTFVPTPGGGQRWVWFAEGGRARLWSGSDVLSARRDAAAGFAVDIHGSVVAQTISAQSNVTAAGAVTANQVTADAVNSPSYTGAKVAVTGAVTAASVAANAISSPSYTGAKVAVTGAVTAASVDASGPIRANTLTAGIVNGDLVRGPTGQFDRVRTDELRADVIEGGTLQGMRARLLTGVEENEPNGLESVVCRSHALAVIHPDAPAFVPGSAEEVVGGSPDTERDPDAVAPAPPPPPPPPPPPMVPVPPRLALSHDFSASIDRLVLNRFRRYADGVVIEGDALITGELSEASSITLKDDVTVLAPEAATHALRGLEAVTYRYKQDSGGTRHVGFIAEYVPELVARPGRDRLRAMDIVAVLTTVVQAQQATLDELSREVAALRTPAP